MSKFATDLKWIRQQLEHAQAVIDGQKSLGAKVVWDEQKQSSVNQNTSRLQEDFSGLVIHLKPEVSRSSRTVNGDGLNLNKLIEMKKAIASSLDQSAGSDSQGLQRRGDELHQRSGLPPRQRQAVKSEAGAGLDHCPSGNGSGPRRSAME